jgi:hypothetical protein
MRGRRTGRELEEGEEVVEERETVIFLKPHKVSDFPFE